jgi:Caspase domain
VRFPQFVAAAGLALVCILGQAYAAKRVALVIGNDRYINLPAHEQLQKAVNDARAVGDALKGIGFEVVTGENLGRRALLGKLGELIQLAAPGDTAFFFFSGHGVAVDGVNYVLPTDVPDIAAGQETLLKGEAIAEQYVISELTGRGVRVAVVVLDACRTNPFSRPGGKGVGFTRGLAPPPQVQGVFSLYAAASGQSALDRLYDGDPNPNSVFSRVLVPMLTKPGLDLRDLAYEVREEVARLAQTAGYDQKPEDHDGTVGGRVYLAGPPPQGGQSVAAVVTPPAVADPAVVWRDIQNTTSLAVIDDFILRYGNVPVYGPLARARREEFIKRQSLASSMFSTGMKLTGRDFVFGARYDAVNALLEQPFRIPTYDSIPRAGEYNPDDIRYLVVRLNTLPSVLSALRNLASDPKCIDDKSYIVFFFKNGNFFRISVRLYHTSQCSSYHWIQEALFSPGQRKLSLTGGKGNVGLLYREDDYFSYLEIYQQGIARDDDNFISSLVLTGPPASFR